MLHLYKVETLLKYHYIFFEMGDGPPTSHQKYAYDLFYYIIQTKVLQRAYIKNRGHQATPTSLTMGEDRVTGTLCPENTQKSCHQDLYWVYSSIMGWALEEMAAFS
jgi:hypothetical protein